MFAFRKPLSAGIAALLITTALPACAQPAPAATDADPALWVVKDEDTTIYLFGTVHVLKPGLSWFDEAVKDAFDKSDQLVLEMVEPDAATQQQLVVSKGMAAPGTPTVTQQLPESKRAAYAKALTDLGMPANAFDRLKPWMAAMTLTIMPLQKKGYDLNSGAEKVLTSAAQAAGKPVIGLETFEQQLGFFDGLSSQAQVTFLSSTIDELPKVEESMQKMVTEWAEGDAPGLAGIMNEGLKDSPEVAKVLLTDRNTNWANWIVKRLEQPGTIFVAVGAGHLAGAGSVQDALAKHKVKAERIPY